MKHEVNEFQNRNANFLKPEKQDLPEFYLDDNELEELKVFCQELNPYNEISLEEKLRLQEYGIKEFSDPFFVTNQLLLILENNLQYREKNDSKSSNPSS